MSPTDCPQTHASVLPVRVVRPGRGVLLVLVALVLVLVGLAWFQPDIVLRGSDVVGYAICHQIPARSFSLPTGPLPLCARCTGTFLGSLLGFGMIFARRRERCREIPPLPVTAALMVFVALWGLDGLNSYLTLFEHAPHLYEPHNMLRLATGLLNGLALSSVLYPVFSFTVWAKVKDQRSIEGWRELGVLLIIAAALGVSIWIGWPPLLYLLSMASVLGVLAMLFVVNSLLAVVVLRRENRAARWWDLWLPLALGALGVPMEIGAMNLIRHALTQTFGLPF